MTRPIQPLGALLLLLLMASPASAETSFAREVEQATALWTGSCGAPAGYVERRIRTRANRCTATVSEVKVRHRRARDARRAQAQLANLVTRYEQSPDLQSDRANGVAMAQARFYQAEALYEEFMAIEPLTGLNFTGTKRKGSEAQFTAFYDRARTRFAALATAYEYLRKKASPDAAEWALAASERVASSAHHFVSLYLAIEIPVDVRRGTHAAAAVDAFCDATGQKAEVLATLLRSAAAMCSAHATHLGNGEIEKSCEKFLVPNGSLQDPRVVRRVVRRLDAEYQQCYAEARTQSPALFGTVTLAIDVAPDGTVHKARATGLTEAPALGQCLTSAVQGLRFPKPASGAQEVVNYPLTFTVPIGSSRLGPRPSSVEFTE